MSNARVIRRPATRPTASSKSEGSASGKLKWIVSVALLLLLAVGAWAYFPGEDPALARIHEIRDQMEGATDAQRRELFGTMRKEFENLSPDARDQLRDEWRQRWEAREQENLNKFFAMSPQEQIAHLDEDIKREEERRKAWQRRRAESGGDSGARGNRGGGPGMGGGGRGRGSRDSSDPNARRKSYLDNTTPQSRAMRSEYRHQREERRRQLGLPPGRGRR